ncbi:unnamed protein product, partial [Tetraodon nigroviridis]
APGGPSGRSGHRMVASKKQLLVFGGFHENSRDFVYYNDIYAFSLEAFSWSRLSPSGFGPSPRSACQMTPTPDGTGVIIYGGYSKVVRLRVRAVWVTVSRRMWKRGPYTPTCFSSSERGKRAKVGAICFGKCIIIKTIPSLSFAFRPLRQVDLVKGEPVWEQTSSTLWLLPAVGPGGRAVLFGGVCDEEEEESLSGDFYNDLYLYDIVKNRWFPGLLRGNKSEKKKRRRGKRCEVEGEGAEKEEAAEAAAQSPAEVIREFVAEDGTVMTIKEAVPVAQEEDEEDDEEEEEEG